jgi:DNA polymerase-3 subunit alpha
MESLHKYHAGLHVLTGCASSALYTGSEDDAKMYIADLMDTVGHDNISMEMMFVGTHNTWERPLVLGQWAKIPWVVTNDTHYPCQHQFPAHQAITKARKGYTYDSKQLWLKTAGEIVFEGQKWVDGEFIYTGLNRSLVIADHVSSWDMRSAPTLPFIEDVETKLKDYLVWSYQEDTRLKGPTKVRKERLQYEWRILKDKKFLDYIYILWDIVQWAKKAGIYVGPGRGSGGGSYVLYLLGITTIDPIEYDLLFERFINPSRSDYPDVDVDFESDRRGEVMEYAANKWGTIPIATYSCYSHKSAIHDIARVLSIPKDLEVEAAESGSDSEKFEEFMGSHEDAYLTYDLMMGQVRHRGKHAAGVVIANRPVPIERAGDELVAAWAEGMNTKDLSKVGIVKYDLLGLTALSQLHKMADIVGTPDWTYDDPRVFDLFCEGDVAGIFQWSGSDGIRDLTMRVAPRNFYDLATCNALYRPGALDAGTAEHYPEYMKKPRLLHPRIDPLLEKTYGVLCYQEQVMAVVAEVMGGSLTMADNARKLLSKSAVGDVKWEEAIVRFHANFMKEGGKQGFERSLLEKLWHEVYTHSGYSYNLAHAAAYTMISYQMAWYKVTDRAAFTVSVLQYDKVNAQTYILDAIEHGLRIHMPHINFSTNEYRLLGDSIYLPLSDVAYLGDKAAEFILEKRGELGAYTTYEEFDKVIPKRVCNNRARTMMERIGVFQTMLDDPSKAIKDYESIPFKSQYETQLEILGYVVPSRELLEKMKRLAEAPAKKGYTRFAGFISKIQKKKSVHGEYSVFNLSPTGSFWMRTPRESLKVGVFVSGTKSKFGHSTDVRSYKLDTGD